MSQQNLPNTNKPTVQAHMKVQSFISSSSPTKKELEKLDAEMSAFLATIDNQSRFLNGRNSYAVGDKVYSLIWYLEKIEDTPVTTPFGKKDAETNNSK